MNYRSGRSQGRDGLRKMNIVDWWYEIQTSRRLWGYNVEASKKLIISTDAGIQI